MATVRGTLAIVELLKPRANQLKKRWFRASGTENENVLTSGLRGTKFCLDKKIIIF